jgi:hypothetical protein
MTLSVRSAGPETWKWPDFATGFPVAVFAAVIRRQIGRICRYWMTLQSNEEIWNMVAFLQQLPSMSAQEYRTLTQNAHARHEDMEDMKR